MGINLCIRGNKRGLIMKTKVLTNGSWAKMMRHGGDLAQQYITRAGFFAPFRLRLPRRCWGRVPCPSFPNKSTIPKFLRFPPRPATVRSAVPFPRSNPRSTRLPTSSEAPGVEPGALLFSGPHALRESCISSESGGSHQTRHAPP